MSAFIVRALTSYLDILDMRGQFGSQAPLVVPSRVFSDEEVRNLQTIVHD